MRIGVTSENKIKLDAVINAYKTMGFNVEIIGYSTDSKVGEQPVENETLTGARNRIEDLVSNWKDEGLDRIISIENGIYKTDNGDDEEERSFSWIDKAVVIIYDPNSQKERVAYSKEATFPTEFVDKAREIGFDKITVGQVMADSSYIQNAKDPHKSIIGVPRQDLLEETIKRVVRRFEGHY